MMVFLTGIAGFIGSHLAKLLRYGRQSRMTDHQDTSLVQRISEALSKKTDKQFTGCATLAQAAAKKSYAYAQLFAPPEVRLPVFALFRAYCQRGHSIR
ncbi:MAG: hypothetical protein AB8B94_16495 [Hyphomicrobiales bacterium]